MRTALGGVALLLTIAISAAGCSDSGGGKSPSPSPTPSASPTPQTPEERASAGAEAAITKYFEVTNELGKNPKAPLSTLDTVAISTELSVVKQNKFAQWRKRGWKQTGDTKVIDVTVKSVSLDNSSPAEGKVPEVTIEVCGDVSDVDVVDRTGKSVITDGRAAQWRTVYGVANYSYKTNPEDGWRVAWSKDVEGEVSCS